MICPACDLPILRGEPRVYVEDEPVHEYHDTSGAEKACGDCNLIHAPAQVGCW